MRNKKSSELAIAMRVSFVSIAVNIALSAGKLIAGIVGRSGAMISVAVHSASDVFSTVVVIIGVRLADKKADEEHPYGHERLESAAAIILAAVLMATGLCIGYTGLKSIFGGGYDSLAVPTVLPLIAAAVSIAVKEWMYWYTRAAAKKINSDALMADAWHHRSDSLSSVGSLIGIAGARLAFPILDPIAGVVICLFIIKSAYNIFRDAMDKMVDKSCDKALVDKMRKEISAQPDVIRLDEIKTRLFGSRIYVDIEIAADASATLKKAHEIATEVHNIIEEKFPSVKHCMVHVNPCDKAEYERNDKNAVCKLPEMHHLH
ncbi:cation diffusion facilitator family transporter [Hominimerdicola sp. 21CYCFAH17_S]